MKKKHTFFLSLLAVSVLLAGCGTSSEESNSIQSSFQIETALADLHI